MPHGDDVIELIWEGLAGDGRAEGAVDAEGGAADHLHVWLAAGSVSPRGGDTASRRYPGPVPSSSRGTPPASS